MSENPQPGGIRPPTLRTHAGEEVELQGYNPEPETYSIRTELAELQNAIDHLEKATAILRNALDPILRPELEMPHDEKSPEEILSGHSSPVVSEVAVARTRIRQMAWRIEAATSRLEV